MKLQITRLKAELEKTKAELEQLKEPDPNKRVRRSGATAPASTEGGSWEDEARKELT